MGLTLAISSYILFDPADWLFDLMELTWMSVDFRLFILALAASSFSISYFAEKQLFQPMAAAIGKLRVKLGGEKKKRKEYKIILEGMRI
jgi:cation-transporting ATPase 13A3/4/5